MAIIFAAMFVVLLFVVLGMIVFSAMMLCEFGWDAMKILWAYCSKRKL